MNKEQVLNDLQNIFRDVFDDEEIKINQDTTSDDVEGWDSLQHILILAAVEKKYGFKFKISETRDLKDVGALVSLILAKLNAGDTIE